MKEGWLSPAFAGVDDTGRIQYLSAAPPDSDVAVKSVNGYALPGFRNSHSHAFQYAMAGTAEQHAPGANDDFWSWREAMYGCALGMRPDAMEAIASMLYAEMLRYGYTHVVEFHYLHHDEQGKPYANVAEMGERLLAAAAIAGIKITLVPVWYQRGDFNQPAFRRQRRFICPTREEYFKLLDATKASVEQHAFAKLGFGVHSLRAVTEPEIGPVLIEGPRDIPFHLHVSEQRKEVDMSVRYLGQRPAEWLLRNLPLDSRFHLVHCTHLTDDEVTGLARAGAQVVLCPGTEGNLGDGLFRLGDFAKAGGQWSIGTDSQINLNPVEDLRWLDYGQRVSTHRRNTFDDGAKQLTSTTWQAGNRAAGIQAQTNYFAVGQPFDAVVYDASVPLLSSARPEQRLSVILYTCDPTAIRGTIVNGRWIVENGRHESMDGILHSYGVAMRAISNH